MTHAAKLLAACLLPAALVLAQDRGRQTPAPQPVPAEKGQEPAPAEKPAPKDPAQEPAKEPKQEPGKDPAKDPGKQPAGQEAGKPASQPGSRPAEETKKPLKPGEVEKVKLEIDTKDASEKDDIPVPEGANEEDIRVIRGATAMLKAEKRLGEILKNLKIKGEAKVVPFEKLESWPYEDGFKGMPEDLWKLDKKRVVMAGFMLPIYEVENIKTFFLVRSLWSCCYGVPPDTNGLVRVKVKRKEGINYQYDPIFIVGTFHVKKIVDDDYVICLYELEAEEVRVLELEVK